MIEADRGTRVFHIVQDISQIAGESDAILDRRSDRRHLRTRPQGRGQRPVGGIAWYLNFTWLFSILLCVFNCCGANRHCSGGRSHYAFIRRPKASIIRSVMDTLRPIVAVNSSTISKVPHICLGAVLHSIRTQLTRAVDEALQSFTSRPNNCLLDELPCSREWNLIHPLH